MIFVRPVAGQNNWKYTLRMIVKLANKTSSATKQQTNPPRTEKNYIFSLIQDFKGTKSGTSIDKHIKSELLNQL